MNSDWSNDQIVTHNGQTDIRFISDIFKVCKKLFT